MKEEGEAKECLTLLGDELKQLLKEKENELSDNTKIRFTPWIELKEELMANPPQKIPKRYLGKKAPKFTEHKWKNKEVELITKLITA